MATVQALQRQGWYLTTEGITECTENGKNNADDIIKIALDMDLKDVGEKHLPDGKSKADHVDGPFVLQIQKLRNVTAPKFNEESQAAPKLFKLSLTDGHVSYPAVEMDSIDKLNLNTPPGTKVKLLRQVPINQGFLLINSSNCKVLGGRVEKLVENWELKRTLAKQARTHNDSEGGPPLFVPFGQRRRDEPQQVSQPTRKENFRSIETTKDRKEDKEFEQQRQAIIDKALQAKEGSRPKTFGAQKQVSDRDISKIVEMGFSAEQATRALKEANNNVQEAINLVLNWADGRRGYSNDNRGYNDREGPSGMGRGRGGRDQRDTRDARPDRPERGRGRRGKGDEEEFDDVQSKPSAPATLFDFLTKKIPAGPAKESKGAASAVKEEKREEAREGRRSRNTSESDGSGKRGPQNLPPRLLKQQQRREEQRHRNTSGEQRDGSPPPEPVPNAKPQPTRSDTTSSKSEEQPQSTSVQRSDDYRGQKSNEYRNQRSEEYGNNQRHHQYQNDYRNQRPDYRGQNDYRNQRPDYRGQRSDEYGGHRGSNYQRSNDYRGHRSDNYRGQRSDDYRGQRSDDYRGQRSDDYRGQRSDDYNRGQRSEDYRGHRSDEHRPSRGRGQHFPGHQMDSRSQDVRDRRMYDSQNRYDQSQHWSGHQDNRRHNNYNSNHDDRPKRSNENQTRVHESNNRRPNNRDYDNSNNSSTQDKKTLIDTEQSSGKSGDQVLETSSSGYNSQPSSDTGSTLQDTTYQANNSQNTRPATSSNTKSTEVIVQATTSTLSDVSTTRSVQSSSQVTSNGSTYTPPQAISSSQYEYVSTSHPMVVQNQSQMMLNGDTAILAMQQVAAPVQNTSMVTGHPVTTTAPTYNIPQHVLQQFQGIQITGPPPVQTFVPCTVQPASQTYVQQPSYISNSASMPMSLDYNRQKSTVAKPVDNRGPRVWKVGDYCMAKYYPENKFYRAMVQSPCANNQSYYVVFPDYGNTEEVAAVDIRPVPLNAWEANTILSPGLAPAMMSQGGMTTMTMPASMSGVQGQVMMQSPTMSYVPAFPTDQSYQGQITNLEFHQQAAPQTYTYQTSTAPVLMSSHPGTKSRQHIVQ